VLTWELIAATNPKVLPIAPDDNPITCEVPDFGSCGIERFCVSNSSGSSYCLHKALFPGSVRDSLVMLLIGGCCFMAAMAGLGGGGLNLPIIIICLNFTPKEASVLSNAAVFGNCVGQLMVNIRGREDLRQRGRNPVIETVLMFLPGLMAGGSVAIAMKGLVPSTVILILALVTLVLASAKTYWKARMMKSKERTRAETSGSPTHNDSNSMDNDQSVETGSSAIQHSVELTVEQDNFLSLDFGYRGFCTEYAEEILIASCWGINASFFVAIRSNFVTKCSAEYFTFVFLPVVSAIFFVWKGRTHIMQKAESLRRPLLEDLSQEHQEEGAETNQNIAGSITETSHPVHPYPIGVEEDNFNNLAWWIPLVATVIGLLSALLGIGGGELVGPILLLLNMNPKQSSATTATLSLLNSAANALHYSVSGMGISFGYSSCLWFAGFIGGGCGRTLAMKIAVRSGGSSIIAYSLFFVLCIAAGLITYELYTTPASWKSEKVC